MVREVKLSRIEATLAELDYPITGAEVIRECGDVRLVLADGTEELVALVGDSNDDTFASPDELTNEIMNRLPRRAVGEPYQSEGEG